MKTCDRPHRLPLRVALMAGIVVASAAAAPCADQPAALRFAVSYEAQEEAKPLDGRILLLLSTDPSREPRFQIRDADATQQVFGIDVEGVAAGQEVIVDASAFGYPARSLAEIPAGEYWVQGLFHLYETFQRSDGHVVKLPMDRGEGQKWNQAPGNLYSAPRKVAVDPAKDGLIRIHLDQVIPKLPDPADTKYVKHIRIQSPRLTEFWGRPMHLGAILLLPEGFDEHPEARYPLAINHGHFQREIGGWRETPPDPELPAADMDWIRKHCPNGHAPDCDAHGYERVRQEHAYRFFEEWTGPDFPRVIQVVIQHANPYYDDSYAVNSANVGPYGDAITHELIPHIEEHYRGLGPWARALYGGSTGGWEALAAQVFYPDEYNGAYVACPDPIDFRWYTVVNIYEHENAYYSGGPFKRTRRPGQRNYLGELRTTLEATNHRELALGTRSRSGDQWDIWQAVYGPVGPDGYPKPIWDKLTGEIDRSVAEYWRENYDLSAIMQRDWATLGPKLRGKLHIYVGEMDNYYLNNAVYVCEDFLAGTTDPPYDGTVDYGARDEHCWSGDHDNVNAISRLTYESRFIPKMVEHWLKTAPEGADTQSWRY